MFWMMPDCMGSVCYQGVGKHNTTGKTKITQNLFSRIVIIINLCHNLPLQALAAKDLKPPFARLI